MNTTDKMTTAYDVAADKLIKAVSESLRDDVKLEKPDWARDIKTGADKERQPEDADWWWTRAASVLRRVYMNGPIGVQRLRTGYGSNKNRGHKPNKFARAGGKIIRSVLMQLDQSGFTDKTKTGRVITSKGRSYMDGIASKLARENV